jgi:hypothetical protein
MFYAHQPRFLSLNPVGLYGLVVVVVVVVVVEEARIPVR